MAGDIVAKFLRIVTKDPSSHNANSNKCGGQDQLWSDTVQILIEIWPPYLWGKCPGVGLELLLWHSHCSNKPLSFSCSKLGCFEIGIPEPLGLHMADQLFPRAGAIFIIGIHTNRLLKSLAIRRVVWALNVGKLFPQEGTGCSPLHHTSLMKTNLEARSIVWKSTFQGVWRLLHSTLIHNLQGLRQ